MKIKNIKFLSLVLILLLLMHSSPVIALRLDENALSASQDLSEISPLALTTINNNQFYGYSSDVDYYESAHPDEADTDDDSLQRRANCYGFAIRVFYRGTFNNQNIFGYDGHCFKQQLGMFSRTMTEATSTTYTIDEIVQFVTYDLRIMGYTLEEINVNSASDIPSASSRTGQRLLVTVTDGEDFHFYMQNGDNTWSHKMGDAPATSSNASGNIITNSNILTSCQEYGYNKGYRFFWINKPAVIDSSHLVRVGTTEYNGYYVPVIGDMAGNTFLTARDLGTDYNLGDSLYTAGMNYPGDVDYFAFKPTSSGTFNINLSLHSTFSGTITVYNGSQTQIASSTFSNTTEPTLSVSLTKGNYYYVKISSYYTVPNTFVSNLNYDMYIE